MSTRDGKWFFTSEAVTMGHPDKMADQVSDAILDAIIKDDPNARVACETLVKTGMVLVAGEITTNTYIEVPEVVRQTVKEIGYDSSEIGFDYHTCAVLTAVSQQSADIDEAVTADSGKGKDLGAGDQGIMFGYASNETELYMPLPIDLARKICWRAAEVRLNGEVNSLRPAGKAQVAIENVVAAGLADRCEIQLSYAIGVAKPLSVFVETFGTGTVSPEKLTKIVEENFDFTPRGLIEYYNLRRPIYKNTARYGHVGVDRPE